MVKTVPKVIAVKIVLAVKGRGKKSLCNIMSYDVKVPLVVTNLLSAFDPSTRGVVSCRHSHVQKSFSNLTSPSLSAETEGQGVSL